MAKFVKVSKVPSVNATKRRRMPLGALQMHQNASKIAYVANRMHFGGSLGQSQCGTWSQFVGRLKSHGNVGLSLAKWDICVCAG